MKDKYIDGYGSDSKRAMEDANRAKVEYFVTTTKSVLEDREELEAYYGFKIRTPKEMNELQKGLFKCPYDKHEFKYTSEDDEDGKEIWKCEKCGELLKMGVPKLCDHDYEWDRIEDGQEIHKCKKCGNENIPEAM